MDRKAFYASLRARGSGVFGTSLSQSQVNGLESLLDEAISRAVPLKHFAYMLATAYHETAHTMQPIREIGKGKGRKYGVPTDPYGHVYYGRGYVQLTWIENYAKASKALGVNFVKDPDRVMEPKLAAAIMFVGMSEGWFTERKLTDYILGTKVDYVGARRIINGTDKAKQIAGYAVAFETALLAASYRAEYPNNPLKPVAPAAPKAPETPETPETPAPNSPKPSLVDLAVEKPTRQPDDPGVDPDDIPEKNKAAGKALIGGIGLVILAIVYALFGGSPS